MGCYNIGRGIKRDEYGDISVHFARTLFTYEPFVLASQAKQIFYVKNANESNWHTVIEMQPRDLYQMSEKISNGDLEPLQQSELQDDHMHILELVDEDVILWNRNDVLEEVILKNNVNPQQNENGED